MIHRSAIFLLLTLAIYSCTQTKKSSSKADKTDAPVYVSSDEGKKWNVFGVKITGKILSDKTNGDYAVITTETPPKGGPPMHVHTHEDELFYVLKGTYIFNCGDKKIRAGKGDLVRLPRGIPHNFVNIDSVTGITMNTITPGGFEHFFDEIAKASKNSVLNRQEIDSIANNFGVRFIKK